MAWFLGVGDDVERGDALIRDSCSLTPMLLSFKSNLSADFLLPDDVVLLSLPPFCLLVFVVVFLRLFIEPFEFERKIQVFL